MHHFSHFTLLSVPWQYFKTCHGVYIYLTLLNKAAHVLYFFQTSPRWWRMWVKTGSWDQEKVDISKTRSWRAARVERKKDPGTRSSEQTWVKTLCRWKNNRRKPAKLLAVSVQVWVWILIEMKQQAPFFFIKNINIYKSPQTFLCHAEKSKSVSHVDIFGTRSYEAPYLVTFSVSPASVN